MSKNRFKIKQINDKEPDKNGLKFYDWVNQE